MSISAHDDQSAAGCHFIGGMVNYGLLLEQITALHGMTTGSAAAVNQILLVQNWLIGAWIVEFEQFGAERVMYGSGLLKRLAEDLEGIGAAWREPRCSREDEAVLQDYPQLWPAISATASAGFLVAARFDGGCHVRDDFRDAVAEIVRSGLQPLPAEAVLRLSWSHFVELLRLDDPGSAEWGQLTE